MADSIVIAAALAHRAGYGGHAWALLQYVLGFRELGFEVTVVDRLEPGMVPEGTEQAALDYLGRLLEPERIPYSVLDGKGGSRAGLPYEEALARAAEARFLLNVMGFVRDRELLEATRRRVFLDIDPGFRAGLEGARTRRRLRRARRLRHGRPERRPGGLRSPDLRPALADDPPSGRSRPLSRRRRRRGVHHGRQLARAVRQPRVRGPPPRPSCARVSPLRGAPAAGRRSVSRRARDRLERLERHRASAAIGLAAARAREDCRRPRLLPTVRPVARWRS